MKGLYLLLDGLTLLFPVLLSFDSRVHYVGRWKSVFISATLVAIPFLIWDVYFTASGVWGFNSDYLIGTTFFHLPIEEILFFWVVPFACTFIYECTRFYFRDIRWSTLNKLLVAILLLYAGYLASENPSGWYTIGCSISLSLALLLWYAQKSIAYLGIAFVLSLLPFLAVNGILTGSFIEKPIVWYSESHFSGLRIGTIPMEDVLYSFSLIALNILVMERLAKKR